MRLTLTKEGGFVNSPPVSTPVSPAANSHVGLNLVKSDFLAKPGVPIAIAQLCTVVR